MLRWEPMVRMGTRQHQKTQQATPTSRATDNPARCRAGVGVARLGLVRDEEMVGGDGIRMQGVVHVLHSRPDQLLGERCAQRVQVHGTRIAILGISRLPLARFSRRDDSLAHKAHPHPHPLW